MRCQYWNFSGFSLNYRLQSPVFYRALQQGYSGPQFSSSFLNSLQLIFTQSSLNLHLIFIIASLFDGLNNLSNLDYDDSAYEALCPYLDDAQDSSEDEGYPSDQEEEDPNSGPDLDDPEPPGYETSTTTATSTPFLPYAPKPICPPVTATTSSLTIQAIEALILNDPVVPKKSRFYSIGARVSALALLDCGTTWETIFKQTSMTKSGIRRLRVKAIE